MYEIYPKIVPFKKEEIIIYDKRNEEEKVHDINRYLRLKSKVDNPDLMKDDYNDYTQLKNDETIEETLLQIQ
jgi:hypothetical protein